MEAKLSAREIEVVRMVANGFTSKQIAQKLKISRRTVDTHRGKAMLKLVAKNAVHLVLLAKERKIIE